MCGVGGGGGGGWRTGNSGSGVLVVVVYANSVCDAHRVPWCNNIKRKQRGGKAAAERWWQSCIPKISVMHVEFLKLTVHTKKFKEKNVGKSGICVLAVVLSCACQLYA